MPIAPRKSLEPYLYDAVEYYPHQVEGIRQLANRSSFILGDDMGLGKSLQALTIFIIDIVRGWAKTAIVVCPVTLKGNWADEITKFTRLHSVTLEGSPANRTKQLAAFSELEGPKMLIVNYEQVVAHLESLNALGFDVAIYDEAHYMKNHKSKRTKACLALKAKRSFMLTGTPMLNKVDELWPLLHKVQPSRFPKYWGFVNRYAVFGGYKDKQIIGVKNEKELIENLHDVMLRRLKKDVLDLPDVQILERRVNLAPEARKLYDEVLNDMRLTRVDQDDPDDIENALTKFLRLKQICGTTKPFNGKDISEKLDLAIEDDQEIFYNGHKIVVFTQFRDVQKCYVDRLHAVGIKDTFLLHGDIKKEDRQGIVRNWAEFTGPSVLVCMLQVASLGLNLVAARHGSFLDELFVPGLNQQAIDRLHRIGADTTQPVQIRKYITRNTIENRVQQILKTKSKLFGEIVESDPGWKKKLLKALLEEED